jgi:hypothetical protein
MRRGTLIVIVSLLVMLTAAAAWQWRLASQDGAPYPGPQSPGALP